MTALLTATPQPYTSDDISFTVQDRRRYGFFITDNEIIDVYASRIGPYAFTVYSALLRFANKDGVCFPSLNTLAERLGFSKPTVIKAIETLIEHGLIQKVNRFNDKGEHISNLYLILEVKPESAREEEGGKFRLPGGGQSDLLPRQGGGKRDLPKQNNTFFNKTQQQEQDTHAPRRRRKRKPKRPISERNQSVVVALTDLGISHNVAAFLAEKYSKERISEKIAYFEFLQGTQPESIKNPCGWLRTAIVEDYGRPDGFMTAEERQRQEIQAVQQSQAQAERARTSVEANQAFQDKRRAEKEARRQSLTGQYGTRAEDFAFWEKAQREIKYTTAAHIAALTADMDILQVTDDAVVVGVERADVWRQLQHPNIQKAINRACSAVAGRKVGLAVENVCS
jgi:DNA-binding Lrp family transcriptional regulator